MKRLPKYLGLAALALVLVFAITGWALNRWLQSPAFRLAFEHELGTALRLPVKIRALTFSMWSGIVVEGLSSADANGSAFEAAGVSARHRLSSLLLGKFTFREVRLTQPHFRFVEDAAGKWRLAQAERAPTVAPAAAPASAPAPPKPAKSPVSIERIVVSDGTVEWLDKMHAPVALLTGLNLTLHEIAGENFSGTFDLRRAALPCKLALESITGAVRRDGRMLRVAPFAATSGGGSLGGSVAWVEGGTGTAELKFDRINLARTAQEAGAVAPRVGGSLSGEAKFAGIGGDKNALAGTGEIHLSGGSCREIELLRQIGEVLQIAAMASFEISDVRVHFSVAQGQVMLAPADIFASPVGVTLTGPVALDGAVNLTGLLHAPADFVNRNGLIAGQFSAPDAAGRRAVEFNITGTLQKPRQNLAEKLTGTKDRKQQRIIAAGSIISAIMNQKKPKSLQPAPEPAPAPAQP